MTKEEITAIADRVSANISGNTKEVLTSEEQPVIWVFPEVTCIS